MNRRPQRQKVTSEQLAIPEGANVIVRRDDGSDFPTKTRSKPWARLTPTQAIHVARLLERHAGTEVAGAQ